MMAAPSNESEVPNDDWLYRRVPIKPQYYLHFDVLTGERRLGRGAFRFDDDGMSVYREALMVKHKLTTAQIRRDNTFELYRFMVHEVRKLAADVIDDPDLDDMPIGLAHASIRCNPDPKPPPAKRRSIQEGLIAVAELVPV